MAGIQPKPRYTSKSPFPMPKDPYENAEEGLSSRPVSPSMPPKLQPGHIAIPVKPSANDEGNRLLAETILNRGGKKTRHRKHRKVARKTRKSRKGRK